MSSLGVLYRPYDWDGFIGQKYTIEIIKDQIKNKNFKSSLFAGKTGSGKTTCARLIGKYYDAEIIEIDAASNNGVDNIRAISESAYERSLSNTYKLFILDEAHMLTIQSWNALLKVLEEPPQYTLFILCTTDPQKIPQTILNRVQRFNFNKISPSDILDRLKFICSKEDIDYDEEALDYVAHNSDGSMREALSILDLVVGSNKKLTSERLTIITGGFSYKDIFFALTNNLLDGNDKEVLNILDSYDYTGGDFQFLVNSYLNFCLNVLKYILFKDIKATEFPNNYQKDLDNIINFNNPENYYNYVISKLINLKNILKNESNVKEIAEVAFLQISRCK